MQVIEVCQASLSSDSPFQNDAKRNICYGTQVFLFFLWLQFDFTGAVEWCIRTTIHPIVQITEHSSVWLLSPCYLHWSFFCA